jgi:hypothetical protein
MAFGNQRSNRDWKASCLRTLLTLAAGLGLAPAICFGTETAASVDFDRDVRPILSDKCFQCHGPDAETRAADLRLDTRDGLTAAVAPGDAAASELIRRI